MWFDKKVNFDIHKFDEFYQVFVNENCEYSAENVHFYLFQIINIWNTHVMNQRMAILVSLLNYVKSLQQYSLP